MGFEALISVRSGGMSDAEEVSGIRGVVSFAIWVVVTGLAPVVIGSYDISGHELWLVCGLVGLVMFGGVMVLNYRANRELLRTATRADCAGAAVMFWPFVLVLVVALIVVVLGLLPDQEAALHVTAVAVGLSAAASMLPTLVFLQHPPATSPDQAELPSPGESSA